MGNNKWAELTEKINRELTEKLDTIRADKDAAVSAAFMLDGELIASVQAGTVDCESGSAPVTDQSLFNIGSISKVYCAMAVMKLTELGQADLDTPVYEYLPEFKMKDKRYKQITLRMCLNHTSGLPGTLMNGLFGSRWLGAELYEKALKYFANSILKAEPGAYSVYCNDGFILAEMVVDRCSGVSYADFLMKYITRPAGALSACTGANAEDTAPRVHEKGKLFETLSMQGSGGVISNLNDCAVIGNLFIDPDEILSQTSIDEIARPQGKSFLVNEVASQFGYAWDSVSFQHPLYDFGPNTLMKSGGTLQFGSYLLVSRKHKLSAAISATMSNGIEPLSVLCDMCAAVLEAAGISISKEPAPASEVSPALPSGFDKKYTGIYHNFMGTYSISFADEKLMIKSYVNGTMMDMIPGAVYDGERFNFGPMAFSFQSHNDNHYLIQESLIGNTTLAQTVSHVPEPSKDWIDRIHKKYIACDISPYDTGIGNMYCGLTIDRLPESNLLLFCTKAPFLPFGTMPVGIKDGNTYMPLDAPGGAGSRDQFAPVVFNKDGVEYIYDRGFTYIDAASLEDLAPGDIRLQNAPALYHIPEGQTLTVSSSDEARCILLSEELDILYDGPVQNGMPAATRGFIILLGEKDSAIQAVRVYE